MDLACDHSDGVGPDAFAWFIFTKARAEIEFPSVKAAEDTSVFNPTCRKWRSFVRTLGVSREDFAVVFVEADSVSMDDYFFAAKFRKFLDPGHR